MSEGASLAERARELYESLDRDAKGGGYNLNPDSEMVLMLCEGLATNVERYGYMACPCRLPTGNRQDDLDIICPCDYRDPDLSDYGACYCALYVSDDIVAGRKKAGSIPERRPFEEERKKEKRAPAIISGVGTGVWRCKVCGYLCAMPNPPGKCPICKADKDRFEETGPGLIVGMLNMYMNAESIRTVPISFWRCRVCGYLCAMENPPLKCPVCKADKDRFEKFL